MKFSNSLKKKINHIAIIMDGNGRWAKRKKIPKRIGHEKGIKNCINICQNLHKIKYQVNQISFYVFSTENWNRKAIEVKNLFKLIEDYYLEFENVANTNNLIIRHCGSRKRLSKKQLQIIDDVTNKTKNNTGTSINLMFNYGSREEINDAIQKLDGKKTNINDFRKYFYINNLPDPDLIIRTGGEQRLSNFMLWQSAYSELYFTKSLWPDFKYRNLLKAMDSYFERNRKYGK